MITEFNKSNDFKINFCLYAFVYKKLPRHLKKKIFKYCLLQQVTCQDDGKDGTHLRISKSLMVNVSNVNEPPYDILLSRKDIDENNVMGQLVGEIMVTDPDSQQVHYHCLLNHKYLSSFIDQTVRRIKVNMSILIHIIFVYGTF